MHIDLPQQNSGNWTARGTNVQYLRLQSGDPLRSLHGFSPYEAVFVIEDAVDFERQMAASRWLADSGCFYIFVWTNNCSSWDGSVDLAKLEQFENGQIYVVIFIMMSWHNGEPPQEMALLAKYSAQHQTIELENMHFLQIGSAGRQREFKDL